MHTKSIIVAALLFLLIVIGMFVFAFLRRAEIAQAPVETPTTTTSVAPSPYSSITRIDAKHFYVMGVHTIVGQIIMPTPCDLLNWSTSTVDATHVSVNFEVVNHAKTCDQNPTPQRFKVSWTADQGALIMATFMGRLVTLNLVPAASGETPEAYELFQKG